MSFHLEFLFNKLFKWHKHRSSIIFMTQGWIGLVFANVAWWNTFEEAAQMDECSSCFFDQSLMTKPSVTLFISPFGCVFVPLFLPVLLCHSSSVRWQDARVCVCLRCVFGSIQGYFEVFFYFNVYDYIMCAQFCACVYMSVCESVCGLTVRIICPFALILGVDSLLLQLI